ncbi:unnamed protein product [Polarella glacialis]|uniref:Uncharacterized protein n=1 Tax=Polarella glacialis TaxID=89957 RepID=A0A813LTY9_POLGL|nr:unnamed protein product [Polarella glacialis]
MSPLLSVPCATAETLDGLCGSDTESHLALRTTFGDDHEEIDDIFRFITAIQEQRWPQTDVVATFGTSADQLLKYEDCHEQHGDPQPALVEDDLQFPGLPFLSYSDAVPLSAVSTYHSTLVAELLCQQVDPTPRSANPSRPSEFEPRSDSPGLSAEALYAIL